MFTSRLGRNMSAELPSLRKVSSASSLVAAPTLSRFMGISTTACVMLLTEPLQTESPERRKRTPRTSCLTSYAFVNRRRTESPSSGSADPPVLKFQRTTEPPAIVSYLSRERWARSRSTTDFFARFAATGVLGSFMNASYIANASSRGVGITGESTWRHGRERSVRHASIAVATARTSAPSDTRAAILARATTE